MNNKISNLLKTIWYSPQLRNILILSLFITLIFPLYNKFISQPKFNALLINFIEDDASRVNRHLVHEFFASKIDLLEEKLPPGFNESVYKIKKDFILEKVKLFGHSGKVLYSTNEKDIGKINKHHYFHNIVASGQPFSKVVFKSHATAEGRIVDRSVIETYSPIMDNGRFVGAFELYYDATHRKHLLDNLFHTSAIQMMMMVALLITALLIVQIRSAYIVSNRDEIQKALEQSESRFRNMALSAQDGIIEMDSSGIVAFWNQAAEKIFGISSDEALGQDLHQLIVPQRFQIEFQRNFKHFQKSGTGQIIGKPVEIVGVHKDGREIPLDIAIATLKLDKGYGAIGIVRDITLRKEAEQQQKLSASIIMHALQGIIVTDSSENIQLVNPAFKKITGYSLEDVIGEKPSILSSGRQDESFYIKLWQDLQKTGFWEGEIWNRRADGTIYPEWLSLNVIRDSDNKITNYVGMFSDISTLKKAEEELERLAYFDMLTGIPNRMLFTEHLNQMIKDVRRDKTSKNALLFIDLDYFKQVNDAHGHEIGDLLLQEVVSRMSPIIREVDTIARYGGDEFVIILRKIKDKTICQKIADNIIVALAKPFYLKGAKCRIGASIGIAIYPDDASSANNLLKCADNALYHAKKTGRNNYQFFRESIREDNSYSTIQL